MFSQTIRSYFWTLRDKCIGKNHLERLNFLQNCPETTKAGWKTKVTENNSQLKNKVGWIQKLREHKM